MGGCCHKGEISPEEEPYGIIYRRKCTDILALLLFLAFWAGMIYIATLAEDRGNPYRDRPYLYWANPLDLSVQICVEKCPQEISSLPPFWDPNSNSTFDFTPTEVVCLYDVEPALLELGTSCWPVLYRSRPVLNRCAPTTIVNGTVNFVTEELNAQEVSSLVLADLVASWPWILVSVGIAVVLGFTWLLLMRLFSGVIVWLTIIFVYLALGALAAITWYAGYQMREKLDDIPPEERLNSEVRNERAVTIISYVLMGIFLIMVILLIWMRRRIQLAIGIIKEATKAIAAMPSIIGFPAFIFLLLALFYVYWTAISFFLGSASTPVYRSSGFAGYNTDRVLRGMQIYHFFGFLWTSQFIVAIGQTSIAGAIASWYWTVDKEDIPSFPVFRSFGRVIRYHLGSMALGSLIIAVVKFIRAILKWLQKRLVGATAKPLVLLLKALGCLFWCFEKVLKFINKNAYIMIAIKGQSFCKSANRAFTLIVGNILRVGTVGVISSFLLFLGKLFVVLGTTIATVYILMAQEELNFWVIPAIIIALISYFVASAFVIVYGMAIDTILLSFCEDSDRNDGSVSRPYFMSDSLQDFVDGSHQKSCFCC